MKKFILSLALCLGVFSLSAQDYDWAIGVRGGSMSSGLTVKHNISTSNAWEGTLSSWYGGGYGGGLLVTGLYEWTKPVIDEGFTFYYGAGAHLGFGSSNYFALGVDGVAGLEYLIPSTPIALSLDYRPHINIVKHWGLGLYDFGLGVKFCF